MKKLLLHLCFSGIFVAGMHGAMAQNPYWSLTPDYYNVNASSTSGLPQPTELPDGTPITFAYPSLYYQGETAQYASNVIRNQSGEIEFFIIDAFVYDKYGYAITTLQVATGDATGSSEILVVPDPANCNRYYIVSTTVNSGNYEKLPYLFSLDMSLPNDIYLDYNCDLKGALVPMQYFPGNPPQPVFYIEIDDISKGSFIPPDPGPGKRSGVFLASSKKRTDGSYKVFISNGDGVFTFTVDATGFNFTNLFAFPGSAFNPADVRGEMDIAELSNGNYRIAVPYKNGPYSIGSQHVEQRLYTAELNSSGLVIPGTEKIFNTLKYNPGGVNQSARYRGVEFSEDGRYLYVTHTVSALDPNAFEYYDYSNPTSGLNPISLPVGLNQSDFAFSMIERGFNNDLYLANQNGLYRLADMSNPASAITHISTFSRTPTYEGQNPLTSSLKMYMLPDQIDGMDYDAHFNTSVQCCLDSKGFNVGIYTATTNATWSVSNPLNNGSLVATIEKELRIPAGVTITISGMTLKFAPGAHLVIENGATSSQQGGKLILNNTTLTSDDRCSNSLTWLGVEVWGNQLLSQGSITSSNQGRLIMNNSKIENASIGVLVSKRKVTTSQSGCAMDEIYQSFSFDNNRNGGIVQVTNSELLNNQRGVWFRPYESTVNNLSYIKTSDFIWNDNINTSVQDHAKLETVYGITFNGCNFKNDITTGSYALGGYGIYARESQFYVTPFCSSIYVGQPCNYTVPNTFQNLNFGIRTWNNINTWTFTCIESLFQNNRYGIYVSNTKNESIQKNTFEVREATYQTSGISLYGSSGYKVQENELYEYDNATITNGNGQSYGIVVNGSGESANEIYKNYFHNLKIGGQTEGINGTYVPNPDNSVIHGLQWLCNDFQHDIYSHDLTLMNGRMNYHQGVASGGTSYLDAKKKVANNKFSLTGEPTTDQHDIFVSNNSQHLSYAYIKAPRHEPDSYTFSNNLYGNVVDINEALWGGVSILEDAGTCPSKIRTIGGPIIDGPPFLGMEIQQIELLAQIDGGQTDNLLRLIDQGTSDQIRDILLSKSPYLSDEVLIKYVNSNPPSSDLLQVMLVNSGLSDAVKEVLTNHTMPNGIANQIADAQNKPSPRAQLFSEINYLEHQIEMGYAALTNEVLLGDYTPAELQELTKALQQNDNSSQANLLLAVYTYLGEQDNIRKQKQAILALNSNPEYVKLANLKATITNNKTVSEILTESPDLFGELDELISNTSDEILIASVQSILDALSDNDEVPAFLTADNIPNESKHQQRKEIDLTRSINVSIYPNPTSGIVHFDYPDKGKGTMEIQVINLKGQIVAEFLARDIHHTQIDLSYLGKGYYLVKIKLDGQVLETQKLELL